MTTSPPTPTPGRAPSKKKTLGLLPQPFQSYGVKFAATYNGVKHDRDSNFHKASLDNAFDALTAFFIMLCAQYGWDFALTGDAAARAFFCLKTSPQWSPSEYYIPAYGSALTERRYKFSA